MCPRMRILCLAAIAAGWSLPARADFINGGFEDQTPNVAPGTFRFLPPGAVPGWTSTALEGVDTGLPGIIEIWGTGLLGVDAYEGENFAELNADTISTLYQEVDGIAAESIVGFEFAHRARGGTLPTDVDVMRLTITDLGADDIFDTADDTILFTKLYADNKFAWGFHTSMGEAPLVALGNRVRFAYEAVSTASGNDRIGNFLDKVSFGVGVAVVPEPLSVFLLGTGLLPIALRSRRPRR